MNFFFRVIAITILAFVFQLFMPWWSIFIAAFAVEFSLGAKRGKAFLTGFVGIFILWFVWTFVKDLQNASVLAPKVALVLPLQGNAILLMLVTALIGALVGGLGSATGSALKVALDKK